MASSRKFRSTDLPECLAAQIAPLVPVHSSILVGLSGGVDSVVLLHLLYQLAPRFSWRLSALHIHHGISPNADAWADFCADLCARYAVPLQVERVDIAPLREHGIEAAARKLRHAAFARQAADFVALAHHADDQAETLLLQLLRGSGVKGAAAMPLLAERVGSASVLRPLLHCSRREILDYAAAQGLRWIEDESNADDGYPRNFLRHRVLPLLEQKFPACRDTLARSAQHFAEASALLDDLARLDAPDLFPPPACGITSDLAALPSSRMAREPLIKSHMAAHSVLRDGMQGARGSEWLIPFATSATQQTARKTSAHEGCEKIARSRRCAPRHRSPGYDLRRTPCDHHDFVSNAAHGGLNQRFPSSSIRGGMGEGGEFHLEVSRLQSLSHLRAKNLLRWFLHSLGAPMPDHTRLEEMLHQLCDARQDAVVCITYGDYEVRRYQGRVYVQRALGDFDRNLVLPWRGEAELAWPALNVRLVFGHTPGQGISLEKLQRAPVTLRLRQGGETLRPHPDAATRTLKNLLQEHHVPPWQRERLPLLYCGDELVCVPGVAIAAEYQAVADEAGVSVGLLPWAVNVGRQ